MTNAFGHHLFFLKKRIDYLSRVICMLISEKLSVFCGNKNLGSIRMTNRSLATTYCSLKKGSITCPVLFACLFLRSCPSFVGTKSWGQSERQISLATTYCSLKKETATCPVLFVQTIPLYKPRVRFGTYPRLIRIQEIKRCPPPLEVGELEGNFE